LSSESASTSTPQRPSSPPPPRKRVSTFTVEESTWARPPAEDVYERLEEFFPEHDLDKPVIEASSGGTSPTNTDQPAPPVAAPTARVKGKKSIRLVAQERKKYIDRTSRVGDGMTNIQRKRSTKLWGSRVEEVDTSSQPESPSTSEGPSACLFLLSFLGVSDIPPPLQRRSSGSVASSSAAGRMGVCIWRSTRRRER
jgi:mitogen-activated protein kinase kinase kinase